MKTAFVIKASDNVATCLDEIAAGETVSLFGESDLKSLEALDDIHAAHKIALCDIEKGDVIVKYGMPIGHAADDVKAGQWLHLHNCASNYDERSNSLDGQSGAPIDMEYV